MNTENNLLQTREEEGGTFERTLVASEFVDWLLQEGEMATREEAERLGRRLLEHGIVQHGEEDGATVPSVCGLRTENVLCCAENIVTVSWNTRIIQVVRAKL